MIQTPSYVSLDLLADICWIPLVQGVLETGAPILGLDQGKTLRLALAAEEFILHLSKTSPGTRLNMTLTREASRVSVLFRFESSSDDLWAMNLTAEGEISRDLDLGMDHMGLLLVSRVVDSFSITLNRRTVDIILYQNITYPEIEKAIAPDQSLEGTLNAHSFCEPAEISHACARAMACYPETLYPEAFKTPGEIIDRIAGKEFFAGLVKDEAGTIAGMICWEIPSRQTVEFYGPYLFSDNPKDTARLLIDLLVTSVARTSAITLYSRMATQDLPKGDFEPLARLTCRQFNGKIEKKTLWFRHLKEDTGCSVWAHPNLADFLKKTYKNLFLMRTIREYKSQGEIRPDRSLLGTRLEATRKEATLWPMLDGADIHENICRHIKLLTDEQYTNIFFTIDLSAGWQAALGEILVQTGFLPAYVLPYAGQSDKVIYQYVDPDA